MEKINKDKVRINRQIRSKEVRLIDSNSKQVGVVTIEKALELALQENLDLIEIAPNANPPVCKIIDYGKYRYEVSKREKAARKKQKVVVVKEIKMRPKIDEHDFQTKRNHIQRFIEKGDKVKVSIMFRGRERSHLEIGRTHLSRLTNEIEQLGAVVESPPRVDGANMVMLLAPKPKK